MPPPLPAFCPPRPTTEPRSSPSPVPCHPQIRSSARVHTRALPWLPLAASAGRLGESPPHFASAGMRVAPQAQRSARYSCRPAHASVHMPPGCRSSAGTRRRVRYTPAPAPLPAPSPTPLLAPAPALHFPVTPPPLASAL